jgi:uncharacterized protein YecT (DUF1311 family)
MQGSSTSRAVFVSGLMIGVALALGSVLVLRHKDEPSTSSSAAADAKPAIVRSAALGAGPAPQPGKGDAASCGARLLMTQAAGESTVSLDPAPAKALPGQVASLLLQGKEAVASGRPRDAEASFMNACRTASVDAGGDAAVEMADAKYQLARLYSHSAAGASREAMRTQARALLTASLQTYTARYGEKHEKTRFAAQALADLGGEASSTAVAQVQAPATQPAPKPAAAPVVAPVPVPAKVAKAEPAKPVAPKPPVAQPEPEPAPAPAPKVAKAPEPSPKPANTVTARATREQPSFDCARARSTSEKIICSDDDLARQDRELGKVYARAKRAAPDPRAFQRDSDAEWAQRESNCRDRECLQRWYEHRREQLSSSSAEPVTEASGDAGITRADQP